MALVCASIYLAEDPQAPSVAPVQVDFSIVCDCGPITASWSHDHTACPVEQGASGSPPSPRLHSEVHQVFELPAYVSCRGIGGMSNFHSPDVLEFKFCLVRLHIGTRKAVLLSLCDLTERSIRYQSTISNSWQVAYDTSKTGVLQSWLHGVRHDHHKTNIGRCRSGCNAVSGLKFPHLSVPTMGHLPQPNTCCQLHDGRCRFAKYSLCWCLFNLTPPLCAYRFGNPRLNQAPILNTL